ncbi:uncharacterized protein LAJ45_00664 [Morchella importuna]|uniref:uncharacterized protein n=1 Tax=Morchella importuna TaxID=1174673 RepID=UPI001E8D3339|nr:uncharacterized protein LAJ45_00664 [Morchella importuna]KAH8155654.1 hypothetical protein LAJ45_00664 [Morchella importuna]
MVPASLVGHHQGVQDIPSPRERGEKYLPQGVYFSTSNIFSQGSSEILTLWGLLLAPSKTNSCHSPSVQLAPRFFVAIILLAAPGLHTRFFAYVVVPGGHMSV